MDILTELLLSYYDGKTCNDENVRLRAPIDIFELIKIIRRLEKEIKELRQVVSRG